MGETEEGVKVWEGKTWSVTRFHLAWQKNVDGHPSCSPPLLIVSPCPSVALFPHISSISFGLELAVNGFDKVIPADLLRRAKGFAILTVVKAGFVVSARAGSGIVIARLPDGSWSAPSAIGTAGGGFGFQAGAEMAEFIIILNSRAAVKSFMAAGSLTLGGNMSIAAGPLGRNLEGTGTISSKGKVAAMYSYSRTKGLFGGASLEGSIIVERSDANSKAYGYSVTAKQLLSGAVDPPPFAEPLIATIVRRSGSNAGWVEDEDVTPDDLSRPYAFGTEFASGSNEPVRGKAKRSLSDLMTRSRSGSGSSNRERSNSGSMRLPSASSARFEHDFGDEYERSSSPSSARPSTRSRNGSVVGTPSRLKTASSMGTEKSPFDDPDEDRLTPRDTFGRESFESLDDPESRYGAFSPPREGIDDPEGEDYGFVTKYPRSVSPVSSRKNQPSLLRKPFARSGSSTNKSSLSSSINGRPRGASGASNTRPWDSDDDELISDDHSPAFDMTAMNRTLSQSTVTKTSISPARSRSGSTAAKPPVVGGGLGYAIALYDFSGVEAGDLSFKKNDVITILKKDDEEWWTGRNGLKEGIFPRNYTQIIEGDL